jgi:SAM-dependent methyltransferase
VFRASSLMIPRPVLEVGCGLGSIAQALAKCGCRLTAIDLTQKAVDMTSTRLRQAGLSAQVLKMDAEEMAFPDNSFDYIWSWGVIHHSAHTERIVAEMRRVLRPGGRFGVMVYHRNSTRYWISGILRRGLLGLQLLRKTPEEIQMSFTDGFLARHFSRREIRDLFHQFTVAEVRTLDMSDSSIPFRPLRRSLRTVLGAQRHWKLVRAVEAKAGWLLFIKGGKPGIAQLPDAS